LSHYIEITFKNIL